MSVDLALAKQHCRIDGNDEDALVTVYLGAAIAWVEAYTGKKLTRGSVEQTESAFGDFIQLDYGPDVADLIITYTDAAGDEATITDALIVKDRLYPADGWPTIALNTAIVVSYTAGFGVAPDNIDAAVLLLTGEYYDNREAEQASSAVIAAVESLCRPYRPVIV